MTRPNLSMAEAQSVEYTWGQGHVPTPMGSTAGRVCFLTYVGGDFRWASEYVHIYASSGTWYLYGGSLQSGVKARARCMAVTSYTGEYALTAPRGTEASLRMYGIACGFTRVGGQFKSQKDRAIISQSLSDPRAWSLQVRATHAGNGYVHARGRCVDRNAFLVGSGSWIPARPPVLLSTDASSSCYLTGVWGDLNASTYWVRVYRSSGSWYLEGSPQKDYGGAYGGCVKAYFFGTPSATT